MGPAVGQPAHELERVATLMRRDRAGSLLAGRMLGDGGADEGDVIVRALERREIRIAEIEEDALVRRRAGATSSTGNPSLRQCTCRRSRRGCRLRRRVRDRLLLEISSGHCPIYWRFTFCIVLMLK